ncbi:unnamed protein product [Pleuronectes platessa]|uniref:Uncharacterized protein n=1 Tax=Pleuronectes platessa TaxID=8262 RepID=A0A9N7UAL5_PLEPL|nr:unnamed protein product [Pleuronectes platessa]
MEPSPGSTGLEVESWRASKASQRRASAPGAVLPLQTPRIQGAAARTGRTQPRRAVRQESEHPREAVEGQLHYRPGGLGVLVCADSGAVWLSAAHATDQSALLGGALQPTICYFTKDDQSQGWLSTSS